MQVTFPYEEKPSTIFSKVKRPMAEVSFWSNLLNNWLRYQMIVDSGADYTLLPRYRCLDLGVNLKKDCFPIKTSGVGGQTTVFLLKKKVKIKIADHVMNIPVGFINSDTVPPLLGRQDCLNNLQVLLANYQTKIFT